MSEGRLCVGLQLAEDRQGERLAELDPPLVERVDAQDHALGEDLVLVEGDELAEGRRGQLGGQDRVGGTVALEDSVGHLVIGDAFRPHLLPRSSQGEGLRLGEEVGHQQFVVLAEWLGGSCEPDEVARNEPGSLMQELVEGVLAVGAGLATTGPVSVGTRRPSRHTDLPLLSMSSCWR